MTHRLGEAAAAIFRSSPGAAAIEFRGQDISMDRMRSLMPTTFSSTARRSTGRRRDDWKVELHWEGRLYGISYSYLGVIRRRMRARPMYPRRRVWWSCRNIWVWFKASEHPRPWRLRSIALMTGTSGPPILVRDFLRDSDLSS